MRRCLPLISALCVFLTAIHTEAQSLLPEKGGDRVRLSANIEMKGGYISGVCAMLRDDGQIKCSLFNEFGISALDFIYDTAKDKIKIMSAADFIDKWYIKRILKKDLKHIMHNMEEGRNTYINEKRNIHYEFIPLGDATEGRPIHN